jgi:hypothetical protein
MHLSAFKIVEFLTVLCLSGLKYFFGLVNATFVCNLGFFPSVLLTITGGMAGVFAFILLDRIAIRLWRRYRKPITRVRFTKTRRLIVRIRKNYGLAGIAFLTPILFQVPIGTIIALRLIKDVKKVSFAMLLSFTFFSLIFCGLYYGLGVNLTHEIRHIFKP